jgi:hypothetical protein
MYICITWLDDDKQDTESSEERKDEEKTDDTATTTPSDEAFSEHVQQESQDQQAYLEPILVAMELGQEILQGNTGDEGQTTVW